MPTYVFPLVCPACGAEVPVTFGRRSTDEATVQWRHDGCPKADESRRAGDFFTSGLPTDDDGTLIPPEQE